MFNFANRKFKVVERFVIFGLIALLVIVGGFVDMIIQGMNIGIEFSAGATFEVTVQGIDDLDANKFKSTFENWLKGDRNNDGQVDSDVYKLATTQTSRADGKVIYEFRIGTTVNRFGGKKENLDKATDLTNEASVISSSFDSDIRTWITNNTSTTVDEYSTNVQVNSHTVNNKVMLNTIRTAVLAIIVALAVILVYIGFRFTWISGLSALLALCHDVLIMIALTTLFQIPVNSTFIAAVITIVGYSINATIVIFDRIRELEAIPSIANLSDKELANRAVANTLSRSIVTTLTTLVMISLLAIFGTASIREFALPIIFGLIAGAYSSVLLSVSFWVYLRKLFKQSGKRPKLKVKQNAQVEGNNA